MLLLSAAIVFSSILFTGCASKKKAAYKATGHTSAARQRSTMRSYKVRGKRYTPTYVEVGQKMKGISSWYGPNFHGKYTSNGERYNMHARTAAHKTWPMDTMVRVRNLQNGAGKVQSDAAIAKARRENTETRVRLTNFGVQVGAFRRYEGAKIYRRKYAHLHPKYKPVIKKFSDVDGAPLYRVWLMGFDSEDEARDFKNTHNMPGAFIVRN